MLDNLGYLFSFIALPILISKFDYKTLGIVFTTQAIVLAIAGIANYSFVFYIPSVSKEISTNKNELKDLWNITVSSRIFFSIILGLLSILLVFKFFNTYLTLWLFSLFLLLPKIINPTLFCNALEKNNLVLKIGFFSKLLFLISIYFLNNSNLINLFLGISEFIVILFFLPKINAVFYQFKMVSWKKMMAFFKNTYNLFLVNLFSMLKPASVLPAISYFLGSEYATIYTLADKMINVIRSISGSIFTSFFPIYNKEEIKINFTSIKSTLFVVLFSFIIVLIVWFLSPMIIYVLNDFTQNKLATQTFRILSFSIPMFFIIIPLFSYLLHQKKWNEILLFSIVQLGIFFGLLISFHQTILQVAIGFVLSEYVLLICYYFYVIYIQNRNKIISS